MLQSKALCFESHASFNFLAFQSSSSASEELVEERPRVEKSTIKVQNDSIKTTESPASNKTSKNDSGPNKTEPKPSKQGSSNVGVNLLVHSITIAACFLVAMALKH